MDNPIDTATQDLSPIFELALDLRWTWNHATDELWRELEPELWEATQNPWLILQAVSRTKLQRMLSEEAFRSKLAGMLERRRELEASGAWFRQTHPDAKLNAIAYFSMEFMLTEALPIYSGGLGNVAGDQLKAASDLDVPVIGIGLLYQQGYFRQEIDLNGAQIARYPFNDPGQLPIRPLRDQAGDWLRLKVSLPGYSLWIRTWEAQVGRRRLYLLDTNDPANPPAFRSITSELYGGGPEMRVRQEMVLGIAGWRLLRALGIRPEVCHLNEGHAAFAVLERARAFMEDHQQPFDVALAVTRAGNLFTTHTPVEAGFDRFPPDLMARYFKWYAEERLKISLYELMALGRRNRDDASEPFNMAYLAIRGCGAVNGVSRLHGAVSRRLFRSLFPRWPEAETPVGYVTNGIHIPTWDSAEADELWTRICGAERWRGSQESLEDQMRTASDEDLWRLGGSQRKCLVEYARGRLARQRAGQGAPMWEIEAARHIFDENRLTLGFARRFATYKRPNLLLHDPERLIRMLTNQERPVQLILAGKAHPADGAGQAMIKEWTEFVRRNEVRGHVVFLADYDALVAYRLVTGVDVWINTPRRPWEASGTSGMKVLANGGLNVSELDGWWAEAYAPDAGWAIGDGREHDSDPAWDAAEADALYALLEQQVIPAFYDRDQRSIPLRWVSRMRESMARLSPAFSSNRVVRQYTDEYYLPLASAYLARAADPAVWGAGLLAWEREMASQWHEVRFGGVNIDHRDSEYFFRAEVYVGGIRTDDVQVEIYADPLNSHEPFRRAMSLDRAAPGGSEPYRYCGAAPADRPENHYTLRVIPHRPGVLVPLELSLIAWQR
jgi:glycogen phosphorylase